MLRIRHTRRAILYESRKDSTMMYQKRRPGLSLHALVLKAAQADRQVERERERCQPPSPGLTPRGPGPQRSCRPHRRPTLLDGSIGSVGFESPLSPPLAGRDCRRKTTRHVDYLYLRAWMVIGWLVPQLLHGGLLFPAEKVSPTCEDPALPRVDDPGRKACVLSNESWKGFSQIRGPCSFDFISMSKKELRPRKTSLLGWDRV